MMPPIEGHELDALGAFSPERSVRGRAGHLLQFKIDEVIGNLEIS
ncbi:hypothetical protein V4R08_07400 [Nitrobacter sp. NHB1]